MAAALLLPASCASRSQSPSAGRSGVPTTAVASLVPCGSKRTFAYASHSGVDPNLTSLDVYAPPPGKDGCQDRPVVVWVHGGGWTSGDKAEYMTDKVRLFNDAGYLFVSVNYRLTDRALPESAPRYPVHDDDVADALGWVIHHSRELGGHPDLVAVLGHSAGGGIVAAIASDDRYLARSGETLTAIRCVGALDGEGYDITAGATASPPEVQAGYRDVFGVDPAIWADASPVRHVGPGKGIPRFFIATRGDDWRVNSQVAFIDALHRAGVPTTVLDATALEHIDLTTQVGAPGDTILTPPLMDFLRGCFASSS